MTHTNGKAGWNHAPGVYRRHVLLHGPQVLVVATGAVVGALTRSYVLTLLAFLTMETLLVTCIAQVAWMRRTVDARIERLERTKAAATRAELLLRMSEEHRRELMELEDVARSVREHLGTSLQDFLSLERLIELYVRFAIAHRTAAVMLASTGQVRADEIAKLVQRMNSAGEAPRESAERRLEILRRREETRRLAHERQAAMNDELGTIGDTLRWLKEQCAAVDHEPLRAELRSVLSSRTEDAELLRELVALRVDGVDPEVLRLGRDHEACDGSGPRLRVIADAAEADPSTQALMKPMAATVRRM